MKSIPSFFNKIVLASGNAGKLKEFQSMFAPLGIELIAQSQLGITSCEEPFATFLENALVKARHASQVSGMPALADDSGLIVPALNGAPGVLSARYATLFGQEQSDTNNNQCLLSSLAEIADKRAAYVAVLVLVRSPDDPAPLVSQAMWQGVIVEQAQGEHGFGYDPHFFVPAYQMTAAQMAPALKNSLSHRGKALTLLLEQIKTYQV